MIDRFANGSTDWHNWMRDTMKIDPSDSKAIALVWAVIGRCKTEPEAIAALEAEKPEEDIRDVAAKCIDDLWYCGRVWSAWGYGTMSEDDFSPAAEDENRIDNVVEIIQQYAEVYHAKRCTECRKDKQLERK